MKHRFVLCIALIVSMAACAYATRVASTGTPRFTIDAPADWKHDARTVKNNQNIFLQSPDGRQAMMLIAVNAPGVNKQAAMLQMMTVLQKDVLRGSTVVTPPHPQNYGRYAGMESTVKVSIKGQEATGLTGSFFVGDVIFGIAGLCEPNDTQSLSLFRTVAGSVDVGGSVATTSSPSPSASGSPPRLRDRLKGVFIRVLHKVPIFKPKDE